MDGLFLILLISFVFTGRFCTEADNDTERGFCFWSKPKTPKPMPMPTTKRANPTVIVYQIVPSTTATSTTNAEMTDVTSQTNEPPPTEAPSADDPPQTPEISMETPVSPETES